MLLAPIPPDEDERIAAVRALGLLDGPPEERFDRLTRVAQRLFRVPIVTVTLVDSQREWFMASCGVASREMARDTSFCGHAILSDDLFVVCDAADDPRFQDNPQVVNDGIRFYAGVPLSGHNGRKVGSFCVKDRQPRTLAPDELEALKDLGMVVEGELRLREVVALQNELLAAREREQALQREVQDLRVEIDRVQLRQAVAEVEDTAFFQDLKARASSFRRRTADPDGSPTDPV